MKWCLLDFNKFTDQTDINDKWKAVANNTGNLVFMQALKKILDAVPLTWREADVNANEIDGIITTSLIWLNENSTLDSAEWLLKRFKDKPIVPINVGFQAPDCDHKIKMNEKAIRVLREMQERAVLGVRGEYSAEVLNDNGISNIQVTGCPSVFYNLNGFKVKKATIEKPAVLTSFYSTTGKYFYTHDYELEFLNYASQNGFTLIKQTRSDANLIAQKKLTFADDKLFFNTNNWASFVKNYNFSFGARFHGNVMSVINGVPALFIEVDSRTTEMCRFFKFPTIKISDFKSELSVDQYYKMADYTEFNSAYPKLFQNFCDFCSKNKINTAKGENI